MISLIPHLKTLIVVNLPHICQVLPSVLLSKDKCIGALAKDDGEGEILTHVHWLWVGSRMRQMF